MPSSRPHMLNHMGHYTIAPNRASPMPQGHMSSVIEFTHSPFHRSTQHARDARGRVYERATVWGVRGHPAGSPHAPRPKQRPWQVPGHWRIIQEGGGELHALRSCKGTNRCSSPRDWRLMAANKGGCHPPSTRQPRGVPVVPLRKLTPSVTYVVS